MSLKVSAGDSNFLRVASSVSYYSLPSVAFIFCIHFNIHKCLAGEEFRCAVLKHILLIFIQTCKSLWSRSSDMNWQCSLTVRLDVLRHLQRRWMVGRHTQQSAAGEREIAATAASVLRRSSMWMNPASFHRYFNLGPSCHGGEIRLRLQLCQAPAAAVTLTEGHRIKINLSKMQFDWRPGFRCRRTTRVCLVLLAVNSAGGWNVGRPPCITCTSIIDRKVIKLL